MNKILIVGHPQSGYSDVQRLLHACGMAPAQPSRREGFTPEQISETLCKAHGTPSLHRLGNEREVQQIDVAPVWQSLAMDLMLGNLDQPLWGWADPQAVHLLEYWLSLDPSLHFILVYDRPHSVLTRTGLNDAASLTRETLQQRVGAWSAYNFAVLNFHLRHPERSLLVHSEQVLRSAEASLQQVRARIDAPWKDRIAGPGSGVGALLATTDVEDARPCAQAPARSENLALDALALSTFVAGALLKDQPGSLALYEELQASANLPLEADLAHGEDPALAMQAWQSMVAQQEKLQSERELARKLQAERDKAEQLAQERERLMAEERQLRTAERQDMAQQLDALQQERSLVESAQASAEQESELLLNQLHQVQEELERQFLSGQEQTRRAEALEQQVQSERELARQLQAGRDKAEQLAQERERLIAKERQLRTAEQQDMSQQLGALQQERARVEIELSRRIEALAQQEMLALERVASVEATHEEMKASEEALRQQAQQKISALTVELEALMARPMAAEPDPALAEENELLLSQLHRVQEELERYYLENERLKTTQTAYPDTTTPENAALYGAAERLKQELSYRLGARMVANSRSVSGWMGMPWTLLREVRQYRQTQGQINRGNLPPLDAYRDAYEAERVKQQLSYRLGHTLVMNGGSPLGWLRLPFALRREVQQFRRQRQH